MEYLSIPIAHLSRSWKHLTTRLGPVESFQLAFVTAVVTVAWTETLLYFQHRRHVNTATEGGKTASSMIDVNIRLGIPLASEARIAEYREAVKAALEEALLTQDLIISSVTQEGISDQSNSDSPLKVSEDLAQRAMKQGSLAPINLCVGISEWTRDDIRQAYIVMLNVNSQGEVVKKACAVSLGVPAESLAIGDIIEALKRCAAQLSTF